MQSSKPPLVTNSPNPLNCVKQKVLVASPPSSPSSSSFWYDEEEVEVVEDDDGDACWATYGRRSRRFPPPLPLLARTGKLTSHMPWILERIHEDDGRRLVIREVRVNRHEYFRARRSGGRLTLHLVKLHDHQSPEKPENDMIAVARDHQSASLEEEKWVHGRRQWKHNNKSEHGRPKNKPEVDDVVKDDDPIFSSACIWELSSRRATSRIHRPIAPQISVYLSSRSQFSSAPPQNSLQGSATADNASHSRSYISKLVLGSVVIGAAITAAYKTGYIDIQVKDDKSSPNSSKLNAAKNSKDLELSVEQAVLLSNEETSTLEPDIEIVEKSDEPQGQEFEIKGEAILERVPLEETALKENEPTEVDSKIPSEVSSSVADEQKANSEVSSEGTTLDDILVSTEVTVEQNKSNETSKENIGEESQVSEEAVLKEAPIKVATDSADTEEGPYKSLSESYSLQDEGSQKISREEVNTDAVATFSTIKEGYIGATEQVRDEESSKDGKIVLDLIEAIHAAEKKQAESDAFVFAEERRVLKDKYEKQLKDAKARALMYAEEAAILEKELNREKAKAAAAIKSLQEKSENKLREELQRKDEETDTQLKKIKELSKAELAAAIAKEKSSQIEKIAEADLNINALCMAFYARSEEARQTHSVHKLALGTLALEDALSRGLPIRAEVDALLKSLEGIDKDSLVELALSCLPEEILNNGTSTQMQLNQKFESLKGTLRHFSLIPAGGGGILAHMVAHVASSIKMKEQSGDGIEPVISKVESLLVDGNFVEAADVLEGGVRGSEAEEVVIEWVRQARNRAVAEQALTLLQSYAMSITFT
ncbi:unnamed protein product [Musa acuminata var. zebrina]